MGMAGFNLRRKKLQASSSLPSKEPVQAEPKKAEPVKAEPKKEADADKVAEPVKEEPKKEVKKSDSKKKEDDLF